MRILIDPPLEAWRLGRAHDDERRALPSLAYRGSAPLDPAKPIVATGHQPWLWHPGILAKDFAAVSAARQRDAEPLHIVVDHDVLDATRLDCPIQNGDALAIETIHLGRTDTAVPAGAQPPVDPDDAIRTLTRAQDRLGPSLTVDLGPLIEAIAATSTSGHAFESLAEQISAWTAALMRPLGADVAMVPTSALLRTDAGAVLVHELLADARACVRCYNQAVTQHPEAGIGPLLIERERVELPMWALRWNQPRQRVFADLADATPLLSFEDGTPLPSAIGDGRGRCWLAPRALLLTALMRSRFCDLFIHGKGGGIYDLATEHWWTNWRGQTLAPRAVVSADVHLSFNAPVTDLAELHRAQWHRHHAPFNIDRLLKLTDPLSTQKRRLIDTMGREPGRARRWRRWLAFREIHRINRALCAAHREVIEDADRRLAAARSGLGNARIAHKRDWSFALYPSASLEALRDTIDATAAAKR